ncbi:MAG: phosphatase PAP2 family protein [Bacteroidales bacterium]
MVRGVFLLGFLCWLGVVGKAQNLDVQLLQQIHAPHYTVADEPFKYLTHSVTMVSLSVPATLLTVGWIKNDSVAIRSAMVMAVAYGIAGVLTFSLKYSMNRPRPFEAYPQLFLQKTSGGSPSFPSGHTSLAFAAATSLSLQYSRWYVIVPAYAWAGCVGYSRMYLGVHYPSDVLVGALIGMASAYISYQANRWLYKK